MNRLAVACALACFIAAALAAPSGGNNCQGSVNNQPIWEGDLAFVASVPNGKLYVANQAEPNNTLKVLHVYGTPYQMGVAQAQLLRQDITEVMTQFWEYLDEQIEPYINSLPKDIQQIILNDGPAAALQFTLNLTAPYTPPHFYEEIRGLADGLNNPNITYHQMLQIHMFPELIKAGCSMFGAWGPAIQKVGGSLMQLRALDWGLGSPFGNYPVVVIYHPLPGDGHPFMSVTWTGFIGSVTSYGGNVGVSEKVWLSYNETSSRAGIPFHFLLRDIAQYDITIDDALNRIYNNERTCSIHIGLGSNSTNTFRAVYYAHEEVLVYDDVNFPFNPNHPYMPSTVYLDKHVQPSTSDPCMTDLMQQYYGSLNAENTIRYILGPFQTGDIHAAFYDFGANTVYVGRAGITYGPDGRPVPGGAQTPAYASPWFKLPMTPLFALAQ